MATSIDIARLDDVPGICQTMASVGLGITQEKLKKYFFEVPLTESLSPVRGGVVVRDGNEIVGYCGVAPTRMYLNGKKFDGYQTGVLGLKTHYGTCLFDLLDAVRDLVKDSYIIANTANAKSAKLWTMYGGCIPGPKEGEKIRYRLFPLGLMTSPRVTPIVDSAVDFFDLRFGEFWERYLNSTSGLYSSREPSRLQRIFGPALAARRCVLLTTQDAAGRIEGYLLLRARRFWRMSYKRFEIIDIAVLNHSHEVFHRLLRKACRYVPRHGGLMLEYIGATAGVTEILGEYLPCQRLALANTAFWFSGIPELAEHFMKNSGALFGPLDGDRCNI